MRTEVYKNIWYMSKKSVAYAKSAEEGSSDSVVFGCFPPDPLACDRNTFAVAKGSRQHNYVMICPRYFEKTSTNYQEAFKAWVDRRNDIVVGGAVLLHEMLHLRTVVGWDWHATDLGISADEDVTLVDFQKIKNADNYAMFAMEVKTNPKRAKLQVDMTSSKAKSKMARKLLGMRI
ncbi:hypothetical protein LX32DRAFT_341693 [Colletotrichum zoysiae]|uniref:Lysine-specific metallo-endopeptidase domain-containing protein n=1 Tax=Colletotrichum zoysiae TaxID=1216348 RepID=A0AAD9HLD3_9PEZI|nr:hypothetical protein LX32DRAFT_341693 [Colletotrichum zoysiae]